MKWTRDDFYSDPDSLREFALGLEYTARFDHLPAQRSTSSVIPAEAERAFESLLGIKPGGQKRAPYHGCFQLMLSEDWQHAYVHVDP